MSDVSKVYSDPAMTKAFAARLIGEGACSEFRVFKADFDGNRNIVAGDRFTKTIGGWVNDPGKLLPLAGKLRGVSGYITVNPVKPALIARAQNRVKVIPKENGTKDIDILYYRWMYVDFDNERADGISATDEDLTGSLLLRDRVLADHPGLEASSIWGCSGNGGWLLTRLGDLPNDKDTYELVGRVLASLAHRYGAKGRDRFFVDVKTKNASRVMCLPGTLKCKGDDTVDRPWRMVTVEDAVKKTPAFDPANWLEENPPPAGKPVSVAVPAAHGLANGAANGSSNGHEPAHQGSSGDRQYNQMLAIRRCQAMIYADRFRDSIAGQGGHDALYHTAVVIWDGYGLDDPIGLPIFRLWNQTKAFPPEDEAQVLHKWESAKQDHIKPSLKEYNEDQERDRGKAAGSSGRNGTHAPDVPRPAHVGVFTLDDEESPGEATSESSEGESGGVPWEESGSEAQSTVPSAEVNGHAQTTTWASHAGRIDTSKMAARAEELAGSNKAEELFRDAAFLGALARLEIEHPAEAEAIKSTLGRIAGFKPSGLKAAMAEHRKQAKAEAGRGGGGVGSPDGGGDGSNNPGQVQDFTDMGNGLRLVEMRGSAIRYCKAYGDWLIFDGNCWQPDHKLQIETFAQQVPARILAETPPKDSEKAIEHQKFALATQSKERLAALIATARSMVPVTPAELDRDPWLLNVRNGSIDLQSGEFREHRSSDLITKMAKVDFDPMAECPTWDRFILEIMNGSEELAAYLRRAVGYSITGVIREHVFFFLYGTGRNGKGTFLNTMFAILGDYANEIDSDLLISQNSKQHPTALTELEGRRFVSADESDDGRRLAEGLVKKLTGGNPIQARRMHENFYVFYPTHHLWYAANHKPEIRDMSPGMWKRIKLIPFEVCFDDGLPGGRRPDLELESKLMGESSGILNWMLQGCREWQAEGLSEPEAVRKAVKNYRSEMDVIGWFVDERCVSAVGIKTKLQDIYADYKWWCEQASIKPMGVRKFSSCLEDLGFKTSKSNSTVWKFGVRLKTTAERIKDGEPPDPYRTGDYDTPRPMYDGQTTYFVEADEM